MECKVRDTIRIVQSSISYQEKLAEHVKFPFLEIDTQYQHGPE